MLPVAQAAVDFVLEEMRTTGQVEIITDRGRHVNNSSMKRVLCPELDT